MRFLEIKLDRNYTKMFRAVFSKSNLQLQTKQLLYDYLLPI